MEPVENPNKQNRRRGIYLLPNMFTTAALFAGFYAIVASMKFNFEHAAIAIFIAMVMDGLDGRVARLTNTQSAFGAEYDSLSDMTSFGVAPALVAFNWSLSSLGKWGWLAAFMYTAGAALRLARFNTQLGVADKTYFQGLPSPAAAATIAGLVWVGDEYHIIGHSLHYLVAVITVCVALLMVSNIKYRSFKKFDLRGKVPFVAVLMVVMAFVFISIDPPQILFLCVSAYVISGPVFYVFRRRQQTIKREGSHHHKRD